VTDYNDPIEARRELIVSANMLRTVLSNLNVYADAIKADSILATQKDGCCWGEVHDGLKILVGVLYPDDGIEGRASKILDAVFDGSPDIEAAARWVADENAPMSGYSTSEVREELVRHRAHKVALYNGTLNIAGIIGAPREGETSVDHAAQAEMYLDEQIDECLAALAYRNEPADPASSLIRKLLAERITRLADSSTDTYNDWQRAIDQAKVEAEEAGVEWDDAFVPEYVRERLEGTDD
jgi:hypothetical protein